MLFPQRGTEIIDALVEKNKPLANGTDDQRRELTMMIAEQMRFELGPSWGTKSSSPTNPPSKDSIAFNDGFNPLENWDWQNGTSRKRQVVTGQAGDPIPGQNFIAVRPIDHLGSIPDKPPVDKPPTGEPSINERLNSIEKGQAELKELLESQNDLMHKLVTSFMITSEKFENFKFPTFVGKNRFLGEITFTPQSEETKK